MKTIKCLLITVMVGLHTLLLSSCGILQDIYRPQQDYLIPLHSLVSNSEFVVAWTKSDIRASYSDRRPTIIGGAGKIVVEGTKSDEILGSISALDSSTGDVIWQIPGSGSGNGEKIIHEGVLYRGAAGVATVQTYNLENGELIWETKLPSGRGVLDIYSTESSIFVYTSDEEFHILSDQGELLNSLDVVSRTYLIDDDILYKNDVYSIIGVDFDSSQDLWRAEIGQRWTHAPIFDNGQIFLRTWANPVSIYSIDQSTGKENWTFSQDILSNLYVVEDKIYFISSDSFLVTIDRYTGNEVSRVEITPSFNLHEQVSGYFVSGDPTQDIIVISFGDNTQIMGLKIMNP